MNRQMAAIIAALIGGFVLGAGGAITLAAPGRGPDTAPGMEEALARLRVAESERAALQEAMLDSQERLATMRHEFEAAQAELDAMRAAQVLASAQDAMDTFPWGAPEEADTLMAEAADALVPPDASLRDPRAAQEGRAREWDPERIAAMRTERDQRMQDFFDNAIERAPNRQSQERIAAIEAYTQDAMEIARQWREASTDAERDVIREAMTETRDALRGLLREEHDARVRDAAASLGIRGTRQQQAFADAVREVQRDPLFQGGFGGGRGGGPGAWTGRGGGPGPR